MNKTLKEARKKANLTQDELAKIIGISQGAYALIERGLRVGNVSTWVAIQKALKLKDAEVWQFQKSINKD